RRPRAPRRPRVAARARAPRDGPRARACDRAPPRSRRAARRSRRPRAAARLRARATGPAAVAPAAARACAGPGSPGRRGWRSRPREARRRGRDACEGSLTEDHEMDAAVPCPAGVRLFLTERQLLAVADGGDAVDGDPLSNEAVLHALR